MCTSRTSSVSASASKSQPGSHHASRAGSTTNLVQPSDVSFEIMGKTPVQALSAPFNHYLRSNTIKRKLKQAGALVDKAVKKAARGENVFVEGGVLRGREHKSKMTQDGTVVLIQLFDRDDQVIETGEYIVLLVPDPTHP